jgi:hypothetical protein
MHQAAVNLKTGSRLEGSESAGYGRCSVHGVGKRAHLSEFYRKDPSIWGNSLEGRVENNGISRQHQTERAGVCRCGLRDRLLGICKHEDQDRVQQTIGSIACLIS